MYRPLLTALLLAATIPAATIPAAAQHTLRGRALEGGSPVGYACLLYTSPSPRD